jgi:hypothetical protein
MGPFLGFFEVAKPFLTQKLPLAGSQRGLGPLEESLEMPNYMLFPRQKIISLTFRISGKLIVIILYRLIFHFYLHILFIASWYLYGQSHCINKRFCNTYHRLPGNLQKILRQWSPCSSPLWTLKNIAILFLETTQNGTDFCPLLH